MIEIVLIELTPKVEATEARGIKEEEWSSSTPSREDNEGNDVDGKDQIDNALDQQVENPEKEQMPI